MIASLKAFISKPIVTFSDVYRDKRNSVQPKVTFIFHYTRIKEYFFLALCVTLVAFKLSATPFDGKVVLIFAANLLMLAFIYMINDLEDAPDDAQDISTKTRNPIARGQISYTRGRITVGTVLLIALILFFLCGLPALFFGSAQAVTGFLYSWRAIRLKSFFILDILAHGIAIGVTQFLAAFVAFSTNFSLVWPIAIIIFLFSLHGAIYNQLRDFEADKNAGLRNTAIIIGRQKAIILLYSSIALVLFFLSLASFQGLFPIPIVIFFLLFSPLIFLFKTKTDTRGDEAKFFIAKLRYSFFMLVLFTIGFWFLIERFSLI